MSNAAYSNEQDNESFWARLAGRLRRKRDRPKDDHDDSKRAGQGEPDRDRLYTELWSISNRTAP
jgi:hypothetical protein